MSENYFPGYLSKTDKDAWEKAITCLNNSGKTFTLAEIEHLFIRPFYKFCPPGMHEEDFRDFLWGVGVRQIRRYRFVSKGFVTRTKMRGLYQLRPNVLVKGLGPKVAMPGDLALVRTDARTPDIIDLQLFPQNARTEHVWRLNQEEWRQLQFHLQEVVEEEKQPVGEGNE